MSAAELVSIVRSQAQTIAVQDERIASLTHQLEWFRRQIFGQKSERFAPEPDPSQLHLGETFPVPAERIEELKSIPAHTRRTVQRDGVESGEELKFFDETRVPVRTITLVHEDVKGLSPDQYEVIGEKVRSSGRRICRLGSVAAGWIDSRFRPSKCSMRSTWCSLRGGPNGAMARASSATFGKRREGSFSRQ